MGFCHEELQFQGVFFFLGGGKEVDCKFNSCILVISGPWVIKHTLVLLGGLHGAALAAQSLAACSSTSQAFCRPAGCSYQAQPKDAAVLSTSMTDNI